MTLIVPASLFIITLDSFWTNYDRGKKYNELFGNVFNNLLFENSSRTKIIYLPGVAKNSANKKNKGQTPTGLLI